jgi:hypothetical protein
MNPENQETQGADKRLVNWKGDVAFLEKSGLYLLPVFSSIVPMLKDEIVNCAMLDEPQRSERIEMVRQQIDSAAASHFALWVTELFGVHIALTYTGYWLIPMYLSLLMIVVYWINR